MIIFLLRKPMSRLTTSSRNVLSNLVFSTMQARSLDKAVSRYTQFLPM
jgi:hypothetical protein